MNCKQLVFLTLFLAMTVVSCGGRDTVGRGAATSRGGDGSPVLGIDPAITVGTLDNGLRYYIRENSRPENRMELRLVVRAGSILETDEQRGLAHFCEHMAFNGTEHFHKQALVEYLESIGMRFGPDINAYTGFDQTVYMLQVPMDSTHVVEDAFRILEDWAHSVSYEDEEIDRERGVIVEEWRLGRGADARMQDKQFPVLFSGSKYAERLPIGDVDIIRTFPYDKLRSFYRDWYRPELMGVIAVGDFDAARIKALVTEHFGGIRSRRRAPKRTVFPVPDHDGTLYSIVSDPEATGSSVSIYFKRDVTPSGTESAYRDGIVASLFNTMLNKRLNERVREENPPYLYAYSTEGRFVLSKEFYILAASVPDNGVEQGLEAFMTEALRVKRYGFTESELERSKREMLRGMERAIKERDKTESGLFADEYIRNFVMDEPIPGIEKEYEMYRTFMPGISLGEINPLAEKWITDTNRVVLVDGPDKDGVVLPGEAALAAVLERVGATPLEPYVDTVTDEPLVADPPQPGHIVDERIIDEIGVTEWRLSNGVRVILKPTDFKNDEIRFTAFSPGGNSLVPDSLYVAAATAASVVSEGGAGRFSLTDLEKKLAGKVVSVSPYIQELREGLSGGASPRDAGDMFQLIYLYFSEPRLDRTAFGSYVSRLRGYIENRNARPETAFQDTLAVTLASYHPRSRPWSLDLLGEMNLDKSFAIYQDRFMDAGDFTFILVGAFETEGMRPLVEMWLGGLPADGRVENWRDVGINYPKGIVEKTVYKGIEPKSSVSIVFSGEYPWSRENRYRLYAMCDVLRIRLRESLREDMGGTYGVGVSPSVTHYPKEEYSVTVSFGTDPARTDEMTEAVSAFIDTLKTRGPGADYLDRVKELHRRQNETNMRDNGYWLEALNTYYYNREDPRSILELNRLVDSVTGEDVRATAEKCLSSGNYVKVVLYPREE